MILLKILSAFIIFLHLKKQSKSNIMASVQYTAFISEVKGKIGGTVFQACRGGFAAKNKGGKTKIDVIKGQAQMNRFSAAVKGWSSLTPTEQNTWSALLGVWTFINKFGNTYNGSKFQIFTAANINRSLLGLAPLVEAPIYVAAVDPEWSFSDYSIAGDFEETRGNADAIGMRTFNQITYPCNPSTPFEKARILGSSTSYIASAGTGSIKATIQAVFGGDPPLGSCFYITKWFCWADYPQKQFYQVFKINVVA